MWLLPPHFWPIIYLWTMVGLSCRPAHKLLWQRLKGKHLLGRLLPPWGCRKDRGNVNRDKDRRTHRHQKGFNEDRGQVGVWWPGRVRERTCFTIKASVWKKTLNNSCLSEGLHAEYKVFFFLDRRKISASPVHDILHFPSQCCTPGQKGVEARQGVTLRTLQGVRWVPSFPRILSYKCHEDKFRVG